LEPGRELASLARPAPRPRPPRRPPGRPGGEDRRRRALALRPRPPAPGRNRHRHLDPGRPAVAGVTPWPIDPMSITDPLVLPRDVILVPVAKLPAETRARFPHAEGDWAITHPRSRTPSRILDALSGALVEEFRTPKTIAEAVIHFSREHEADPESTLEEAYPLLQRLLDSGFLVEESAAEAEGIKPSLHPGEEVAGFTVVDCVQGLEDTELHLVRGPQGAGALKIERPAVAGRSGGLFEREEAILRRLDGEGCPRLLASGALDDDLQAGRRWLVTEWLSGIDAATAAWELQRGGASGAETRGELLALARRIAEAYAGLHARGVVHADVHPRNV